MKFSKFRTWAAAICVLGAMAAQSATASVVFTSVTDTFGLNCDISAQSSSGFNRMNFGGNTIGGSTGDVHVEVFGGLNGTGSNVFSGTLTDLWNTDFTQAAMTDGIFSAVATFTGTQLPVVGPPGTPPALTLSLRARGRDVTGNSSYYDEISTFQPANTTVPEPGSLGVTALALGLLLATRRRA